MKEIIAERGGKINVCHSCGCFFRSDEWEKETVVVDPEDPSAEFEGDNTITYMVDTCPQCGDTVREVILW